VIPRHLTRRAYADIADLVSCQGCAHDCYLIMLAQNRVDDAVRNLLLAPRGRRSHADAALIAAIEIQRLSGPAW